MKYGLARLNAEVAAWMRGDSKLDGSHAEPPFVAMGCIPHRAISPVVSSFVAPSHIACDRLTSPPSAVRFVTTLSAVRQANAGARARTRSACDYVTQMGHKYARKNCEYSALFGTAAGTA